MYFKIICDCRIDNVLICLITTAAIYMLSNKNIIPPCLFHIYDYKNNLLLLYYGRKSNEIILTKIS